MSQDNVDILYKLIDEFLHENEITANEFTTLMLQLIFEAMLIKMGSEDVTSINLN